MRYDAEHKERTHERIVQEAALAIRRHGPDKMGVATLMGQVGLTHGGFYAHFKSKDQLVAEAIAHMFDDRADFLRQCLEGNEPAAGLARYVDNYLSRGHRDKPEKGCPIPALSGDLARMPAAARKRFEQGVRRLTDAIAAALAALGRPEPAALAVSVITELVGALTLARAAASTEFSDQVLETARRNIHARAGLDAGTARM